MIPGILSRAPLMFDIVVVAMVVILPVLDISIWKVKTQRNYLLHRKIQIFLSVALLITVVLFEIDVRLHDWRPAAEASPYFSTVVFPFLIVHVFLSVSTTVFWTITALHALRQFPVHRLAFSLPPTGRHRLLGWTTTVLIHLTALTGWIFYYLAFVAL